MNKHTPGPWYWDNAESTVHHRRAVVSDGDGYTIAECERDNARLIAAAPELLEAAELVMNRLVQMDGSSQSQDKGRRYASITTLSLAIAKAKGE